MIQSRFRDAAVEPQRTISRTIIDPTLGMPMAGKTCGHGAVDGSCGKKGLSVSSNAMDSLRKRISQSPGQMGFSLCQGIAGWLEAATSSGWYATYSGQADCSARLDNLRSYCPISRLVPSSGDHLHFCVSAGNIEHATWKSRRRSRTTWPTGGHVQIRPILLRRHVSRVRYVAIRRTSRHELTGLLHRTGQVGRSRDATR